VRRLLVSLMLAAFIAASGMVVYDFFKVGRQIPSTKPLAELADSIRIEKGQRRLLVLRNGEVVREYRVALGGNPLGHKMREGDKKTPEGHYRLDFLNARSAFHLGLRISYPDEKDRSAARERGEMPGSDIMIHGLRNGFAAIGPLHRLLDWTNGCIAVTNAEIEEIWSYARIGTPVEIRP
jgi:murein L,D-transpeptidase YafK